MAEYRLEYSKTGRARWLSHLELIRTFIRALRRSGLPLVFSQGFNPHPKLSYCPSLGVGVAGLREYLDLDLAVATPLAEGLTSVRQQLPPGLEISCLMELPPAAPGIGKAINCAWYRLALPPEQTVGAWQQAIDHLVGGSDPLCYKRPKDGKLFDVRSGLAACRLTEAGGRSAEAGITESEVVPGAWHGHTPGLTEGDCLGLDLLMDFGDAAAPLRGIVETLLPLAGAASCYEPARVTRMALLHQNGGLANPLGEKKQLWEI
jgi:radical SAM-linked protein